MAMIDYGAIAFKNGKLISTEMFTPMVEMVGWQDCEADKYHNYTNNTLEPLNFNGNYFAYIGDSDCTLAFYKCHMVKIEKYSDGTFERECEFFNCTNYTWSKWETYATGCTKVQVTKRNGYYVCKWNYKGDKYKVYFGYGVDLDYYKKRRIVNYYRSPEYVLFKEIPREIKRKMRELKDSYPW